MEPWYRPTDNELLKMRKIVEKIYNQISSDIKDSFLKNDYVDNCSGIRSKLKEKHTLQISSIIGSSRTELHLCLLFGDLLVQVGTLHVVVFYLSQILFIVLNCLNSNFEVLTFL